MNQIYPHSKSTLHDSYVHAHMFRVQLYKNNAFISATFRYFEYSEFRFPNGREKFEGEGHSP